MFFTGKIKCQSDDDSNKPNCTNAHMPATMVVFKFQIKWTDKYYVDNTDGFNLAVPVDAIGGSGSAIFIVMQRRFVLDKWRVGDHKSLVRDMMEKGVVALVRPSNRYSIVVVKTSLYLQYVSRKDMLVIFPRCA